MRTRVDAMRRALSVVVIALNLAGCATLQTDATRATEQMLSEALVDEDAYDRALWGLFP
jgi:hypothetical protein